MLSITLIILILTCVISFTAFSNSRVVNDLIFYPPAISQRNQWYRFITCGFIHADLAHLAFNMFSFYMFGGFVEGAFIDYLGAMGKPMFLTMYITALAACLLPTYLKHKDDYHYRSLGASGAVSAVVFAGIFLSPTSKVGIMFLPPIPGFIFGVLYLGASVYMSKRGGDNINHSAHLWGSIWGIVFVIGAFKLLSGFDAIDNFIQQIRYYLAR